jgi:hypothetical protein
MVQAQATMRRIGLELIEEKRRAAVEGQLLETRVGNIRATVNDAPASPSLDGAKYVEGWDILSVLSELLDTV